MSRGFENGFLRPKKDGKKDSLSYEDKQKLIPTNLRKDVSITLDGVNIVGTYEGYAKGLVNATTINTNQGRFTVSGLGFQPSLVIVYGRQSNLGQAFSFDSAYSTTQFLWDSGNYGCTFTPNSNGFVLDLLLGGLSTATNVSWIAIK